MARQAVPGTMINQRSFIVVALALLALTGCKGFTTHGEREARHDAGAVKSAYRPNDQRPALPDLTTNSSLGDFLTYAMLNQPQIEAAYYRLGGVGRKHHRGALAARPAIDVSDVHPGRHHVGDARA